MKFLLALLLSCVSAFSAVKCVRSAASGSASGDDWTNAYTNLPATVVRGTTYYMAGGTYSRPVLNSASGSGTITLQKATVGSHGTATGWSDAFAATPADFQSIAIKLDDVTIDGVVGQWASAWPGYVAAGIRFREDATNINQILCLVGDNLTLPTNVVVRHVEMSFLNTTNWVDSPTVFWGYTGGTSLEYCWLHNAGGDAVHLAAGGNWTMDHCFVEENGQAQYYMNFSPVDHSNLIAWLDGCTNMVLRYSVLRKWRSSGGVSFTSSGGSGYNSAKIYGNIFTLADDGSVFNGGGNGVLNSQGGSGPATNVFVYNNSFNSIPTATGGRVCSIGSFVGLQIKNNIFSSVTSLTFPGSGTLGFNWFYNDGGDFSGQPNAQVGAGNPFVNSSGGNYQLTANTTPGANLGSPYETDMTGATRTTWTRGALEFTSAPATVPGTAVRRRISATEIQQITNVIPVLLKLPISPAIGGLYRFTPSEVSILRKQPPVLSTIYWPSVEVTQ